MSPFQPSPYSNYSGAQDEDNYGSIWSGLTYVGYRARGYSAEESAIKTFEYQQGREATASEKAAIAKGWSGEGAQLPADVVQQAVDETKAEFVGPLPAEEHAPRGPSPRGPSPSPSPSGPGQGKVPLTQKPWFWPVVIAGSFAVVGGVIWFWPEGKPIPLIGKRN